MAPKAEVFVGKEVREAAQTAGENTRGGATKKCEISLTSLPTNLQRGVNLFQLFAKHQPGVAGCVWLQPGKNFPST